MAQEDELLASSYQMVGGSIPVVYPMTLPQCECVSVSLKGVNEGCSKKSALSIQIEYKSAIQVPVYLSPRWI